MTKLSDAMVQALREIQETGNSTARNQTLTALVKRGLAFVHSPEGTEEVSGFSLTDDGRKAIGVEDIAPGEVDGDFTPENIARAIEEIDAETDEAPVFHLTRRMKREARRNIARYNRRLMRLQGKRARKYGAENVVIKFIAA